MKLFAAAATAALMLSAGNYSAATAASQANPSPAPSAKADAGDPNIPKNIQSYFLAFLVNYPEARIMPEDVFLRHQKYIRSQVDVGVYHLTGPITDGGHLRGLMILSAASLDEARAIVNADPSVQAGILLTEVHPVMLPSLDSLKIEYPE